MKVIDILIKMTKGENIPKFYIDDDRYTFYVIDGWLRRYKNDLKEYSDDYVEWNIYSEWLEREVHIIED